MPAYPTTLPIGNSPHFPVNLSGLWSLRRRFKWTWDQNPNHVSGSHSARRKGAERRYERAEKVRLNLVQALERECARDPEATELRAWAHDLALLTPEAVGAMRDPAAIGPGGGKRQAYYLPDAALQLASLMVRITRRVMKALRVQGRRRVVEHMQATLAWVRKSIARPALPHSVPPQTPEENLKVRDSSKPTSLGMELEKYIAKVRAMQPAEYMPGAASAATTVQEAR